MYEEEHRRPDCLTITVLVPRRIDEADFEGSLHPLKQELTSSVLLELMPFLTSAH